MTTQVRMWLCVAAVAAVVVGLEANRSRGGDDKATRDALLKIAKALQKGDKAGAGKMAAKLAKDIEEIDEVMNFMKPRTKKGLGVGPKAGTIVPDGIELKLQALGRDGITPAALKKEAEALEEAAYVAAAISEVAIAKGWPKNAGKKNKKAWQEWSKDMRESTVKLAEAIKGGGAAEVKAAATKANNVCAACHAVFKP